MSYDINGVDDQLSYDESVKKFVMNNGVFIESIKCSIAFLLITLLLDFLSNWS